MTALKHVKIHGQFWPDRNALPKDAFTQALNYAHPDNAWLLWQLINDRIYPSFNSELDNQRFRCWLVGRLVTPPDVWFYWLPQRHLWTSDRGLLPPQEAVAPPDTDGADGLTFEPDRASERLLVGPYGQRFVNTAYFDIQAGAPVLLNHAHHRWNGRVTEALLATILPPYAVAAAWEAIMRSIDPARLRRREYMPDGSIVETYE